MEVETRGTRALLRATRSGSIAVVPLDLREQCQRVFVRMQVDARERKTLTLAHKRRGAPRYPRDTAVVFELEPGSRTIECDSTGRDPHPELALSLTPASEPFVVERLEVRGP